MSRSSPKSSSAKKSSKQSSKQSAAKKPIAQQASSVSFKPAPSDFVAAFYEHLLPADIEGFSADERARIAASIWDLAATRRKGEAKIHVFNPSPKADGWTVDHTVVEIVSDDMPFLVDSVTGILQSRGLTVHIVIHPVVKMRRDAAGKIEGIAKNAQDGDKGVISESIMHIQVDHCFDGAQLDEITRELRLTIRDVTIAVNDWQKMRAKMQEEIDTVALSKQQDKNAEDIDEVREFLRWLSKDNFTFLGYREINIKQDGDDVTSIAIKPDCGLGILRDDEARMFGGLRDFSKSKNPALRKYVRQNHVLFITKTNAITRVHRVLPMDAVFVRRFNDAGTVISEHLFVGLFTSKTYAQTPREIPVMRRKIRDVIARMGFPAASHDGRSLMHILNTYPHDELFQITEDELYQNAMGILQLQERARVALFPRRDPFGRYVTYLIYVPRDRYDSALRSRIHNFLEESYNGKILSWHVRLDDSRLARGFVTIRLQPDSPHPDPEKLENDLREMCRSWSDRLRDSLVKSHGEATALALLRRYGDAFPETYCEYVAPKNAVLDIRVLENVRGHSRFVVDLSQKSDGRTRLKLFQPERPLLLSESLPLIENMGLKIDYMTGPYEIKFKDGSTPIFIHEFIGTPAHPSQIPFDRLKPIFEEALEKIWSGEVENDVFNALTLRVGLGWRAITVLRAFARYLRQLRIPYSHEMMAAALMVNPHVAQKLYALFYARHNPALDKASNGKNRAAEMAVLEKSIIEDLASIDILEDDRIIRRYLNLVQSSLRTNYFQVDDKNQPKNYLSIKFDSRAVEFMPLPKPLYEIFVYSPQTEAVHLRGGKVARGGIRWSDRRDDFRAEILGLMKAQMVKNSVIVPVGSKGGFIVKRPPAESDKFLAEGIACYTVMMNGLLDITDNSKNGKIVPPVNVVRHDQDDPYLVVAADKGTAKFSDIANGISRNYGFWLDDAFASGGSAGYDHKAMGITARGAWEAIKRHFRELGKDIQTTPFTVMGVGDMSGDVFGNGMLLSTQIMLIGAFDHRHIFCDPTPDTAKSFAERQRMFALPRSSWADYDRKLISKGGGVFARTEKSIKISPEMKKAYGITADTLAPGDLLQAMLKTDAELLYFGGIGTYVKASEETHEEVGDRANEGLRIDGREIRAKVVGEGANLGMTQRGRIEYAKAGGRLNTDAIDNSAGVDTSDHEVNIKILLRKAVDQKRLTMAARDKLLASMTDEVGHLVLRDNYLQTQALSLAESTAPDLLAVHIRVMQILEKSGLLNRAIEYLPNDVELAERKRLGRGLTRPELAVLLSYAKIWLYQKILDSSLPDDRALQDDVTCYFPKALRKAYANDIAQHQLRREIAATVLTNDIVNHNGIAIVLTVDESGDCEPVARAYVLARESFGLQALWDAIDALDNKIPAANQTLMLAVIKLGLTDVIKKLMPQKAALGSLTASIEANHKGLAQLATWLAQNQNIDAGNAKGVEISVARFPTLVAAFDLIALASQHKMAVSELAALYFGLDKRLEISWLKQLKPSGPQTSWQRQAISNALEVLEENHSRLTSQLARKKANGNALARWVEANAAKLETYDALMAEGKTAGSADLALLLLANEKMDNLSG